MALNILSFSVSRLEDALHGITTLQPSWADQPWPYKFSVSSLIPESTSSGELNPAPVHLEGGQRLGTRRERTLEARHHRRQRNARNARRTFRPHPAPTEVSELSFGANLISRAGS